MTTKRRGRIRRVTFGALTLLGFAILILISPLACATRRLDQFVPCPEGAVLHLQVQQKKQKKEFSSIPHSGGGWFFRPKEWVTVQSTLMVSSAPPREKNDWKLWQGDTLPSTLCILDLWVEDGKQPVVALGLELDQMTIRLPGQLGTLPVTCRDSFAPWNAWKDYPLNTGLRIPRDSLRCWVSAFGAVEADQEGRVIRQEWQPDGAGCFTRWWTHRDLEDSPMSMYRPPFDFDRIDRRIPRVQTPTETSRSTFSGRTFLYRKGLSAVGIYWHGGGFVLPGQTARTTFARTFGRLDETQSKVLDLVCVEDSGRAWRIYQGDGSTFDSPQQLVVAPHVDSHGSLTANLWLHWGVKALLDDVGGLVIERVEAPRGSPDGRDD